VLAASGLARRECYERVGLFPLDMPWAGDWYLWCAFAMHFDVAYFAEPMVCYREHDLSMTRKLNAEKLDACAAEEISISWRIWQEAPVSQRGLRNMCLAGVASAYARAMTSERYQPSSLHMNVGWFEKSLADRDTTEAERNWIRARVYERVASEYFWRGDRVAAKDFYIRSVTAGRWMPKSYMKTVLLSFGPAGDRFWKWVKGSRN
jgi:hypothetical protein